MVYVDKTKLIRFSNARGTPIYIVDIVTTQGEIGEIDSCIINIYIIYI